MNIYIKTQYKLVDGDWKIIKDQLKEKHIKVQDLAKQLKVSRAYLYEMAVGRRDGSKLVEYLTMIDIVLPLHNVVQK